MFTACGGAYAAANIVTHAQRAACEDIRVGFVEGDAWKPMVR